MKKGGIENEQREREKKGKKNKETKIV